MARSEPPNDLVRITTDTRFMQRTSNLSRIRENQRRSRARRKEYLQQLEEKYRLCEQTGAEASMEIQAAARKVLDENRRLRFLLKQHGLSDAAIDGTQLSQQENTTSSFPAADKLERMLQ